MAITLVKPATTARSCGFFIACLLAGFLFLGGCSSQRETSTPSLQASEVAFSAMQQVGKPYRYGGESPQSGFDCSGLIQYVFLNSAGVRLPRTVAELNRSSFPAVDASQLNTGDLVIFATQRRSKPDHAGIYVGQGRFVHAPSSGGKVRLDTLYSDYWREHFLIGKRVLPSQ